MSKVEKMVSFIINAMKEVETKSESFLFEANFFIHDRDCFEEAIAIVDAKWTCVNSQFMKTTEWTMENREYTFQYHVTWC